MNDHFDNRFSEPPHFGNSRDKFAVELLRQPAPCKIALFLFVGMGLAHSLVVGIPVTIASVGFAIFITLLELLVAFLQAFVFMFLTTVFIAQLSHHDEEHGHDHEHGAATAH